MEMLEIKNIQNTTLNKLIDFINSEYHSYFNHALPLINTLFLSTLKIDMDNVKQIFVIYKKFEEFKEQLVQHLGKEKHLLFPILNEINSNNKINIDANSFEKTFMAIFNDHKKLLPVFNEIKKLTNNFEVLESYSQTLKQCYTDLQLLEQIYFRYVEIEENIFQQKLINIKNNFKQEIHETIYFAV